jgi:hypothetical protein
VLRIDKAVSRLVEALCGITAGSGLATTEMRIIIINPIDEMHRAHPLVVPTAFVDDVSVEHSGTARTVISVLAAATTHLCDRFRADELEVSSSKSICTAATEATGRRLAWSLRDYGIVFKRRVRSLGTGLGAGTRRAAQVLHQRMDAFRARLPRFRSIQRAGVRTARLLRTGGNAAMTFGQGVAGVSPSALLIQRRAAAAAVAPSAGRSGQSMNLALILADESRKGRADPAFDAHT